MNPILLPAPCFCDVRELQHISKEVGSKCWSSLTAVAARCAARCAPSLWDVLSIFLFPDLIEAIQAENVFCSFRISTTSGVDVSLPSALAATHPCPPLSPLHAATSSLCFQHLPKGAPNAWFHLSVDQMDENLNKRNY